MTFKITKVALAGQKRIMCYSIFILITYEGEPVALAGNMPIPTFVGVFSSMAPWPISYLSLCKWGWTYSYLNSEHFDSS